MIRVVFDTETTSLLQPDSAPLSSQPKIIEYGIVLLDEQYNTIAEYSGLIYPGFDISPEITKITGLTNADLAGKPSFAAKLPEIRTAFMGASIWYAHNLPFDKGMLVNELKRIGMEFSFPYPFDQRCTAQISEEIYGKRIKMRDMYEKVTGNPLAQTHRGLDDARALTEIIKILRV